MPALDRMTRTLFLAAFAAIAFAAGAQHMPTPAAPIDPALAAAAEEQAARAQALVDEYEGREDPAKLAAAEEAIAASLAKTPNSHALVEKARVTLIKGKESAESLQAAELLLQGARNRDFSSGRAYAYHGYVLSRMGRDGEARQEFFRAKQLGPDDPGVLLTYAEFQEKSGDFDGARQSREKLVASEKATRSMRYKGYLALMDTYEKNGNRAKADAAYEALKGIITDKRDSAFIRGDSAQSMMLYFQDFDAGEKRAREALAIMDYPHARGSLSLALYGKWAAAKRDGKDPKVVAQLLKEAQANDPDGGDVPTCALESGGLAFVKQSLGAIGIPPDNSRHKC